MVGNPEKIRQRESAICSGVVFNYFRVVEYLFKICGLNTATLYFVLRVISFSQIN